MAKPACSAQVDSGAHVALVLLFSTCWALFYSLLHFLCLSALLGTKETG